MALRHAVLTALLEGEASGYQLSKRFDVSVADFWSATPPQVYRELERREDEGLLRARLIEQRRRPNKRVFTITAAGRQELHEFTAQPTRPAALRDDLLVKVQAVDVGDSDAVSEAVATRLEHAHRKLALYQRLHENLLDGRTEDDYARDAERIGPYLTLMGGRRYEQLEIDWCEAVLDVLTARGRSAEPGTEPAPA
ncbi:MAG: putative transcriptional regulator [Solirubrobacterales bacterium]|nr:putative transcriptional regulator [Solirubrobacterales bacterium]